MTSEPLRQTPLCDEHERLGGKMVPFAGWLMPVEYQGLRTEHTNVRQKVGLFDVSHMGEIRIRGPRALAALEWLTTNCVAKLSAGQAQYTLLPNEQGGVVDDLIVYCLEKEHDYLLCVNASNKDKDLHWILAHNKGAEIVDESDQWGQIAVQGPHAVELTARVLGSEVSLVKPFEFSHSVWRGSQLLAARTGYTGEDGFEIFVPWAKTLDLWRELLARGEDLGVMPCGLGARDTLRTEMRYPLYGHELNDTINPYSAGLGWVIKPEQKDFVGRSAMLAGKERGLQKKLVGFKMRERGIARQGYNLFSFDNKEIGQVTSGTVSPSLNENIGIAYVDREFSAEGQEFYVEIRQKKTAAQVVKTPFVKPLRS